MTHSMAGEGGVVGLDIEFELTEKTIGPQEVQAGR